MKTSLWAKKEEKDGQYYWLPLWQHMLDTSNIMVQLWNHWLSEGQKDFISNLIEGNDKTEAKLVSFLGLVHDFGKATPSFSLKPSWNNQSRDLDLTIIENMTKAGFIELNDWNAQGATKTPHALASQVLLNYYGVDEGIASIAGGHHGKPVDFKIQVTEQLDSYAANYYQFDRPCKGASIWKKVQKEIFEDMLAEAGYASVDDLPEIKQPAQVLLQGLLIMADWIASNPNFFPLLPIDKKKKYSQEQRLEYGWVKWNKTYNWTPDYFDDSMEQYQNRFQFKPRPVQLAFTEALNNAGQPGIVILEAPMGIGKTEAALLGIEQLAEKGKCSGMFFGMPTQATSDGIFPRIKAWIDEMAKESGDDKSLQLVHGKAQFNELFQNIKKISHIEEEYQGNVIVNEWFTGKKTAILDDFVVGTVDQFLLAALKQKHLALRHLGLTKKVIVIDEVHAYDAYMSSFLYRIVEWLGAYKIPIIILSATLPALKRKELIKTYCRGMGIKKRNIVTDYEDWGETKEYPLITYTDGNKVEQKRNLKIAKNSEIKVKAIQEDEFYHLVKEKLIQGGIAGVIVNTIKRAQQIAKDLESFVGEENIMVIHSSFLAPDRREKERKLISLIGKNAKRPELKIVIGTQVLEQSLDIDFDVLFTDIAPMDLLLQRIGRLHRHSNTKRPENLREPTAYIMGIIGMFEFESGSEKIYGKYLLTRTQILLPDKLRLPEDISKLVQEVYSGEAIPIDPAVEGIYSKAIEENKRKIQEKENNAAAFRLDRPYEPEEDSMIGWLRDNLQNDSEEVGATKVRDGADSIEVILVKRKNQELYLLDENTNINCELSSERAKKISQQTIRLPFVFNFKMDNLIRELEEKNIKELSNWQEEAWLKGSLGIILNEKNNAIVGGYQIHYDKKYGLQYEKEEK